MKLLDLLDSSVESLVTELKALRQENKEFKIQFSNFSIVVADVERLRLENESLTSQNCSIEQLNADNVKLQLENDNLLKVIEVHQSEAQQSENLYEVINELNAKIEAQQSEFALLKEELLQEHKVRDLVLNKVNILLSRLKDIKEDN